MIDALILAGSRGPHDPVAALGKVAHKALTPIAGRPMLAYVLDAVRGMPEVDRIHICIDAETDLRPVTNGTPFIRIPPANSPAASVAAALQQIDGDRPLLITTADHPLLTPEIIAHFLTHAPQEADLCVGLAEAETITKAFPEGRRTFYRLAGRGYSGCNLFLARKPGAVRVAEYWRRMEGHRKNPLRLVREIGFGALIRYALGMLSLDGAFRHVSKLTAAKIAPVILPFAEAATDVDKPSDHALVEGILRARTSRPAR
ncbi:nucleotidyltransferase family protein [Dongia sp.]|uniref:nucleotidyltransferase family protein n=1 Tax=Dongia sp. TaxID=1977262 RepID=UPI003752E339